MSQPMTMAEFNALISHIRDEHSLSAANGGRSVKYVYPCIDMRTCYVFAVTLREWCAESVEFHTQNECRDLPDSLYDRIMAYLDKQPAVGG